MACWLHLSFRFTIIGYSGQIDRCTSCLRSEPIIPVDTHTGTFDQYGWWLFPID